MLVLEKVLFLALKAVHPWEILIEFPEGKGAIYVENRMIVGAEYKDKEKELKNSEAFKIITKKKNAIEKMDIIPSSKPRIKTMSCGVHCIMKILEEIEISENFRQSWIDEFLLNLLSLDTNWIISLTGPIFEGKLHLFNRNYVDAYFFDKTTQKAVTGKEAFSKIIQNREKIKSTEFIPIKDTPPVKFKIDFMYLLNSLNEK